MRHIFTILFSVGLAVCCMNAFAAKADLTRFGPQHYPPAFVTPDVTRHAFFATPGKGHLIVERLNGPEPDTGPVAVSIQINGTEAVAGAEFGRDKSLVEIPVNLLETNALRVELSGYGGAGVIVRVKQAAEVDLHLTGRIHFNVNTVDFDKSKRFYRRLGFADAIGPFPETNTMEVARSVGFVKPYRLYAELLYLGKLDDAAMNLVVPNGRFIDMIEWLDPHNESPAYPNLYHLGIIKAAFTTTDLESDMAALKELGAEFLSQPAKRSDGSRFAITRDPNGTFIELREPEGPEPQPVNGSHVTDIHHLTINVSDFERSREFYRMLGFTTGNQLPATESNEVARAMGLDKPYKVRGEMMIHEADGSRIELVEWIKPRDLRPPHPRPINNYGIHRINYATADLAGDVARLKAQGVIFLSEIAPCCEGEASTFGIVNMLDPDGNFIQVMGLLESPQ